MFSTVQKEILPYVEKPARYVGGEFNSIVKSHQGRTSVALIYPDAYEIGISNLGLKILYHILNQQDEYVCERSYAPWMDMEEKLREKNIPLYSLETKTPLKDFDILGFSFQYELLFTNFLNMLDLSHIEFLCSEREESDPFIMGGGPAAMNLEPIAHFIDAICLGDGESRVVEMSRVVREGRADNKKRKDILIDLSHIDGVYVPSLYKEIETEGFLIAQGKKVERYIEPDLENIDFVTKQILPNIRAIQDRAVIEVARGCTQGCRFCQAGMTYRPLRERSVGKLVSLAREAILSTGYREFSLISLSISDYTQILNLVESLHEQFSEHGVSFSLPSIRIDSFSLGLAKKVQEIRKSGLTFAVEGGTQRIRDIINKGVTEEELFKVLDISKSLGWKKVKLYFMIGLPQDPGAEREDEIAGMQSLIDRIQDRFRGLAITVSVAIFVPKPHTPFQWDKQLLPQEGQDAFMRLLEPYRRNRMVNIRFNNPFVSFLEGVFSRGDRSLSKVVALAWKKGARFDGWNEMFDYELWMECFKEAGIDPYQYLEERDQQGQLAWDVLDNGTSHKFFEVEREKSWKGELTQDCREGCVACDVCDFTDIKNRESEQEEVVVDKDYMEKVQVKSGPPVSSIRFVYLKSGLQKYLSQIDMEELLSRAMIRANIPVKFSEGFNPHIRVEMGWAIPLGFESQYEVSQMDVWEDLNVEDFISRMNASLPEGAQISAAKSYPLGNKLNRKAKNQIVDFEMASELSQQQLEANYDKNKLFTKVTPKKTKEITMDEFLKSFKIIDGKLKVSYVQQEGGARMQDVIEVLTGLDTRDAQAYFPIVVARKSIDQHTALLEV